MSNVEIKKYYAKTLDPVHIGEGGYKLGRVDNTIVRDPATDLPKIPGTSMSGVTREFYTIYLIENDNDCKNKSDDKDKRDCAEKKAKDYFGDDKKQGMVRFYDGEIIFFPVSSIQGTIWITTKDLLKYWFGEISSENGENIKIPDVVEDKAYAIKGIDSNKPLNLGWILLEIGNISNGSVIVLPKDINEWVKRIVIVSDKLFSHIVNDNLEVRTSVRINPETGTADDGALFTYEAIPRGTILGFEVGIDKHKNGCKNIMTDVLPYFKLLGIGGMGTRGFGRIELV
ncbi:type III-B CRISPR module RAMP protein Cmr4 [Thermoanaerobacterium sp. RBIITD]|uniref:type III-B CRISPR module RAMP protein Cmr4 n=1 Tax=Thermoanaerobacterium sp. RBIITD TaxID=1550240 RepID=UPI000BB71F96|nr:type III-B CRISPR module RAMP protein Cmr4 [Thermoanaerobacterium sp. RBIITD]SNX54959.1 CRISPR-associated protein Cmr4 [Thermoanaerobacterium sp. RBIITD]